MAEYLIQQTHQNVSANYPFKSQSVFHQQTFSEFFRSNLPANFSKYAKVHIPSYNIKEYISHFDMLTNSDIKSWTQIITWWAIIYYNCHSQILWWSCDTNEACTRWRMKVGKTFYHCHNVAGNELTSPMSVTVCPLWL